MEKLIVNQEQIDKALNRITSVDSLLKEETNEKTAELKKAASLELNNLKKTLDLQRTEALKPALEEQKRINSIYKPIIEKLDFVSKKLIEQVNQYVKTIKAKKEEEDRKMYLEVAEALIQNKEVKSKEIIFEKKPDKPDLEVKTIKKWKFEVVNFDLVPKKYLTIDESAVNAAIKAGITDISGLKIYQEEIVLRR